MAIVTFNKSATDDGGAIGTALTDGGVDELLPAVSSQDRLHGVTIHRKMWITSDTDLSILSSLSNEGQYDACWFESAGANDVVGDLTGTETKYGASPIVSNTVNTAVVTNNATDVILRANDYAYIGADIVQVTSVTDKGDGTSDVVFSPDIPAGDHSGTSFSTLINKTFVATTGVPFWVKIQIPALASLTSNFNTIQFLTVY